MVPVILAQNLENCFIRETNDKTATVIYATHIPQRKVKFKEIREASSLNIFKKMYDKDF